MTTTAVQDTVIVSASDESARPPLWVYIAIVVAVAIAAYANSWWNNFAFDDDWIIVRNPRVHQLEDMGLIWGKPYWPFYGQVFGLYRPFVIFAFAVQWAASDGAPWLFHVTNTVLHAGVTALVFLLVNCLASRGASLVAALVFAVHPVHTEAVANGVGQAELWAAIGVLGACVLHASRQGLDVSWPRRIGIALLYALAMLSKEAAITAPALLILFDLGQRRIEFSRSGLRRYIGAIWMPLFLMAAVAVGCLAARVDVLGSISGSDANPALPFLREEHRILNAFRAWPEYVRLLFAPIDLSVDYSPGVILPVESFDLLTLLGLCILIAVLVLAVLTPWYPKQGLPAAWFILTIVTVSNLLFPVGIVVAERTLYLPSVALAFILAFAWDSFLPAPRSIGRRILYAGTGILIVLLGARTGIRNLDWKDTRAAIAGLMRDHPESYRSAWAAASFHWEKGDIAKADYYWNAAILLWPRDSQLLTEYANFQIALRNWPKAIEYLHRAREITGWVASANELLAYAYVYAGNPEHALMFADSALRAGGFLPLIYAVRAKAYEDLGDLNQAIGAWRVSVHQPDPLWVHWGMLARVLARTGDTHQAFAALDTARTVSNDTVAWRTLDALRSAIDQGCYRSEISDCPDPLAGWYIGTPQRASGDPVVASQNASGRAASVGSAAVH